MSQKDKLLFHWKDLPSDSPMPLLSRKRVMGEQMMISHVSLERGFKLQSHFHDNEQFACVLEGKVKFGLGKEGTSEYREVTAVAGDVLHLPSNLPHSAEVIESALILDLFSPPCQNTGVDMKRQ